jgi:hypothetical protein
MDTRRTINDGREESQHREQSTTCCQVGPGFSPDTGLIRRMQAMPDYLVSVAKLIVRSPVRGGKRMAGGASPRIRYCIVMSPGKGESPLFVKRFPSPLQGCSAIFPLPRACARGHYPPAPLGLKVEFRDRNYLAEMPASQPFALVSVTCPG